MRLLQIIFTALILTTVLFAYSPNRFSYQAVVRDAGGDLIQEKEIGLKISILENQPAGNPVYVETKNPTTNSNGLFTVQIGSGTIVLGDISQIDWSSGTYYIKTEIDPMGGSNYSLTNTTQLLSVPYALHSNTADSVENVQEDDPVFSDHPAEQITQDDITKLEMLDNISNLIDTTYLKNNIPQYEEDPVYTSSPASSISTTMIDEWDNKLDTITGNEDAFAGWDKDASDDFSGNYDSLSNKPMIPDTIIYTGYKNLASDVPTVTPTDTNLTEDRSFTFTKVHDNTNIEIEVNTQALVESFDNGVLGVKFYITVDGNKAPIETAGTISLEGGDNVEFITMKSVYEDLPAGDYEVDIYAVSSGGNAYDVWIDQGNWGGGIIIKETP